MNGFSGDAGGEIYSSLQGFHNLLHLLTQNDLRPALKKDGVLRYESDIPTSQLPEILGINETVSLPQMLEEILNEKKQALTESPAVTSFLQERQRNLSTQRQHKDVAPKGFSTPSKHKAKTKDS